MAAKGEGGVSWRLLSRPKFDIYYFWTIGEFNYPLIYFLIISSGVRHKTQVGHNHHPFKMKEMQEGKELIFDPCMFQHQLPGNMARMKYKARNSHH